MPLSNVASHPVYHQARASVTSVDVDSGNIVRYNTVEVFL